MLDKPETSRPNHGPLSMEHATWLEEVRKIPSEVAAEFGAFSKGDAIGFPVCDANGQELYCKFRAVSEKKFWRTPGGTKTSVWGLDSLPEVNGAGEALIWTEGEFDRLAVITAGEPWVVSVPDGAQTAEKHDAIPDEDRAYAWLWGADGKLLPDLAKFDRHILAVDGDEKGQILRHNLAIRLGRARCYFVTWPDGCKDANDVLAKHGVERLAEIIEQAKPMVPSLLSSFNDIPRTPNYRTYSTGWGGLDQHMMIKMPSLITVVGSPGAGKSQWTLGLACNLARVHGLRGAILQFEDDVDRLRDDIHRYARAWNVSAPSSNAPVIQDPERWVNEMFLTIPPSEDEADYTLEWIRDTMFEAARRHGCKYIILDPWNELSHIWDRHLTETAYTREALRQIKRWARQLQIAVIIVTHPTKAAGQNKPLEEWDLYSVEASNSWANKSDHGVVVWRETMRSVETYIKIAKSKDFRRMGMPGTVVMEFDQATSLYKNVRSA